MVRCRSTCHEAPESWEIFDENQSEIAYSLGGVDDPQALAALCVLSADADDEVRNWATFGLGTQTEADTPSIRDALAARLGDVDETVRGEAMVGLAKRNDPRVHLAVRMALEEPEPLDLVLEAAELVGIRHGHG